MEDSFHVTFSVGNDVVDDRMGFPVQVTTCSVYGSSFNDQKYRVINEYSLAVKGDTMVHPFRSQKNDSLTLTPFSYGGSPVETK